MEKKLKIAVCHNLPYGGVKRILYTHINYLMSKGHIVDVFITEFAEEDFLPLKNVSNSVKVFPAKRSLIHSFFLKIINTFFSLEKNINMNFFNLSRFEHAEKDIAEYINTKDYDIVYCTTDQMISSPFFLKYLKKPFIFFCHEPYRKEKILDNLVKKSNSKKSLYSYVYNVGSNFFKRKIYKIDSENSHFAKNILANSFYAHEDILKVYGKNSKVSYLGIDSNLFKPLNYPRKNYVLSVGSITPLKGYDFLINSISLINQKNRPKLVLVGNFSKDDWEVYLKDLAQKKGVNLVIKNSIDDESLLKLYNEAKLFVYSPYLEPFGLAPLEALACGTPVVAVKEGGLRETILHKKTGLLVERDENQFANAIVYLLKNPQIWNQMSEFSISYVKNNWTLKNAGERLLNCIYNVLKKEEK